MEPILENIELPSPDPRTPPRWNPANAPVPLEFYDASPNPIDSTLNCSFADFNFDDDSTVNSYDLDISDSEFQSFEEDNTDTSSIKSGGSLRIISRSKQHRRKNQQSDEPELLSPERPLSPASPKSGTETFQYHLITPIFKDRHYYVSRDHPKFKELEGKDPAFDECRYKYYCICVGLHYWKRTKNQLVRAARSGVRRQNAIQVRDRHLSVQTFYYSLTFQLETMAPLKLNGFGHVMKKLKTKIPPLAPKLFTVTYTKFEPDFPEKFTVASEALVAPDTRRSNLPELTFSRDYSSSKTVDPFAHDDFMESLEALSKLDVNTSKSGPVVVTKMSSSKTNSFGSISPFDYSESSVIAADFDAAQFAADSKQTMLSPMKKTGQSIIGDIDNSGHISVFSTSIGGTTSLQNSITVQTASPPTVHGASPLTIDGSNISAPPPPVPKRGAASMNKSPNYYKPATVVEPVQVHVSNSVNCDKPLDPMTVNQTWNNMEDQILHAEWEKLTGATVIENPYIKEEIQRSEVSSELTPEVKHKELIESTTDMNDPFGSNSSLDSLINQLLELSKPTDQSENKPDLSCDVKSQNGQECKPVTSKKAKRPSSPKLPEGFVEDLDNILRNQIADLEKAVCITSTTPTCVSPVPNTTTSPTYTSPVVDLNKSQKDKPLELYRDQESNQLTNGICRELEPSNETSVKVSEIDMLKSQPCVEFKKVSSSTELDLHNSECASPDSTRSQNYDNDALGGSEGLSHAHLRHSPYDSDLDSSSVSSYNSLSPKPKRKNPKKITFHDEGDALDYFKIKHFDTAYIKPDTIVKSEQTEYRIPPPAPPRSSSMSIISKGPTAKVTFRDEADAFDYFKIKHFECKSKITMEELNIKSNASNKQADSKPKITKEFIEQLNNYTPRIQPAVPKRTDSPHKFQEKLMELSRLSEACGQVADQIKHDHEVYWGELTGHYSTNGKSLVSEAYQHLAPVNTRPSLASHKSGYSNNFSNISIGSDGSKMNRTGLLSAAVSDNIVNMASGHITSSQNKSQIGQNRSKVQMTVPLATSTRSLPLSKGHTQVSSPRKVRNEIRVEVTPAPKVKIPSQPPFVTNQGHSSVQGQLSRQGHVLGEGLWGTSLSDVPQLKPQKYKRSVTWSDDLTSTDDDRLSDSSASVTPERKLGSDSKMKGGLQQQKPPPQKKKKKKVSWSDEYNTDDERHSSSTSLSSAFEPNSPDIARHKYSPMNPLGSLHWDQPGVTPHLQRNLSWPGNHSNHRENGEQALNACAIINGKQLGSPVYAQPVLVRNGSTNSQPGAGLVVLQQEQQSKSENQPRTQLVQGFGKTSLGIQRFKTTDSDPRSKINRKCDSAQSSNKSNVYKF